MIRPPTSFLQMMSRYVNLKQPFHVDWWAFFSGERESSTALIHGVMQRRRAIEIEQDQFAFERAHALSGGLEGRFRYCFHCQSWVPRYVRVDLTQDLLVLLPRGSKGQGHESCPLCLSTLEY